MKLDRKTQMVGVAIVLALVFLIATIVLVRRHRAWVEYPTAEAAKVKNVHDYNGKPVCQACHLERDSRIKADPVVLCSRCHTFTHRNHPVHIPAKNAVKDLPLWANNQIVCHTCHDPHDVKRIQFGLRLKFAELCLRCHKGH